MIVISGSSSQGLSADLASELDVELVRATGKRFPDGECYVRIEREELDPEVVIVQNSFPDGDLVELLLLQEAALGMGAEHITTVVPYFGYARQDKRFERGEPISAKVMAQHIQMSSDRIITVDIHSPYILEWFDRSQATDVRAGPEIGSYFSDQGIDLVLAPDEGAAGRAREVASIIGSDWDHLVKTRLSGDQVRITPKSLDVEGKEILIVDDIISTGGTITAASRELRRMGAMRITAACTHGLFAQGALGKLRDECDRVVAANTLEGEVSEISVAPQVAMALRP
ncbi:MAG: ribose-phosphate diphosphokinase [Thermoplasmatota archaeon]